MWTKLYRFLFGIWICFELVWMTIKYGQTFEYYLWNVCDYHYHYNYKFRIARWLLNKLYDNKYWNNAGKIRYIKPEEKDATS